MYCHVAQLLGRGFGLVIGFIGYLQMVTTNNYYTIADLHNLQSLHTNLLSLSALFRTHKVLKSRIKSSQADFFVLFLNYELPLAISYLVPAPNKFCHLYSRGTDTHHRKHMSRDHHPPLSAVTADTENTASSIVAYWTVFTELSPGNALIKYVRI
jgi:hypothetical protein